MLRPIHRDLYPKDLDQVRQGAACRGGSTTHRHGRHVKMARAAAHSSVKVRPHARNRDVEGAGRAWKRGTWRCVRKGRWKAEGRRRNVPERGGTAASTPQTRDECGNMERNESVLVYRLVVRSIWWRALHFERSGTKPKARPKAVQRNQPTRYPEADGDVEFLPPQIQPAGPS